MNGETIKYYPAVVQGSDEWFAVRCGLLTASEMDRIITPAKLLYARNATARSHLYELLAQRITRHVEPSYVSDDMLRGHEDQIDATAVYEKHYAPVEPMGFITNDKWGFPIGYSPDGLVGRSGQIECKGRRQKFQVETIIKHEMPAEYAIQVQTGLLVSERQWCDFVSYCGGVHMLVLRVYPDPTVHTAIVDVAAEFYRELESMMHRYLERLESAAAENIRLVPTIRRIAQEITV